MFGVLVVLSVLSVSCVLPLLGVFAALAMWRCLGHLLERVGRVAHVASVGQATDTNARCAHTHAHTHTHTETHTHAPTHREEGGKGREQGRGEHRGGVRRGIIALFFNRFDIFFLLPPS